MYDKVIKAIKEVGFPIAVASALMVILYTTLDNQTKALNELTYAVQHLDETVAELHSVVEANSQAINELRGNNGR